MTAPRKIHVNDEFCRDCQACMLACSLDHEGACSLDLARLAIVKDMERYEFHILICRHCETPACMLACPSEAIYRDDRGVTIIDVERCDRCGVCADSCPHDAIFYSEAQDRYLKCDLCADRGGEPLCTALCPVGALRLAKEETEG